VVLRLDNDGWPDLFVSSYYVSVDETLRSYLGLTPNAETLKLHKNLGNGTFPDVTAEVGLDRVFMPMGSNFGDIDNDGYLDIYLGTGNPSFGSLLPNVLLHNKGGKFFTDVTAASGTGELHKGHGVVFADIDRDGDEDLLAEIGGAVLGAGNDWTNLKLIGAKKATVRLLECESKLRLKMKGTTRARSTARSAAALSARHRWNSTSALGNRHVVRLLKSGGRLATPAKASRTFPRTSSSRSRNSPRITPALRESHSTSPRNRERDFKRISRAGPLKAKLMPTISQFLAGSATFEALSTCRTRVSMTFRGGLFHKRGGSMSAMRFAHL